MGSKTVVRMITIRSSMLMVAQHFWNDTGKDMATTMWLGFLEPIWISEIAKEEIHR